MSWFKDYIMWAISEANSQRDTAAEDEKINSLMRKRGFSKSKAIAILKASGAISKSYGTGKKKK